MNTPATNKLPTTWLILGERAGDNAQVLALGRALGWPCTVKQIRYDDSCTIDFKDRGASLTGVDLAASTPLAGPWPDVLIAIGRRSVPIARWIRAQSPSPILHVHLGRPRVELELFDLVVTTPQYNLPEAENVIEITLPFVSVDAEALGRAAGSWHDRFAQVPRPWTAVMVGGPTPQLAFGPAEAERMLAELLAFRAKAGASLLVTTSPRTPVEVSEALSSGLQGLGPSGHLFFPFARDSDNPYLAMLALADSFVISVDSASMVAEAATRQKPIHLFHLPKIPPKVKPGLKSALSRNWRLRRKARQDADLPADPLDKLYDFWTRRGKARPRRDIDQLENRLIGMGIAQPLSGSGPTEGEKVTAAFAQLGREREEVLRRINALWADRLSMQ
ncbi:mitochondrial fission ELM1 family protein [Dongia sp.]|uniref:mitochondrial fission ELM1 family protein n=1 Tax=Dongia sp. TaxID=1977262 RepID=UPI0035AE2CE5